VIVFNIERLKVRLHLEVDEDASWDIFSIGSLVIVNIDPLQLKIRVSIVDAFRIDPVLIGNDLPKFGTNLNTYKEI